MSDVSYTAKRRVLVATASVGAGHNSAARAICAGLEAERDDIEIKCVDILSMTPWIFRAYYAGGYALTVSLFPFFYGIGYWLTNRPNTARRTIGERIRLWHERFWMRRFTRFITEYQPDIVVSTHFLAPPLIGWMKAKGLLSCEQMVVVTDNEAHRYWLAEDVDQWFVPTRQCADPLTRWGVNAHSIIVSGIPIHPKWTAPLDPQQVRADWNLPPQGPIILLAGGAEFTCAPVTKIAAMIARRCPQARVVVLGGNNKKLLEKLAKLATRVNGIVPISFTDRAHELVDVASLMVTKAGGISTAECLAKSTPMVILSPVPGQEAANARHFAEQGAAVVTKKASQVAECVESLLADPTTLARLSAAAGELYKPATKTIVSEICRAVS